MAVRVRDLPEQDRSHQEITRPDGSTYHLEGRPVFLYCDTCGGEYSATRGDYFLRAPDHVMRCCKRPLRLVQARRELIEVRR